MNRELFISLYQFNGWANSRMVDAMRELSEVDFNRDMGGSFPSLRKTLLHILFVEQLFFRRWRGISTADLTEPAFDTPSAIRSAWEALDAEREPYLTGLSEADFSRPISYVDTRGRELSMLLWQSLYHLVNHSTFHRGQASSKLRQLGVVPPPLDFVVFCRGTEQ